MRKRDYERETVSEREYMSEREDMSEETRGRLALQLADSQHPALEGKRFSAEWLCTETQRQRTPNYY